uniref:Putative secreted protein n=1 Tax=Ixodes ricinus TaxID=34613 RepID=A0A6B0U3R2_IXORI
MRHVFLVAWLLFQWLSRVEIFQCVRFPSSFLRSRFMHLVLRLTLSVARPLPCFKRRRSARAVLLAPRLSAVCSCL